MCQGRWPDQSAARAPRRTAATVTALALSLALVVLIAVVGASIKTSMRDSYREVVSADLVVESARGEMLGGLVPAAYRTTAALAEVDVVSRIRYGHWKDPHTGALSPRSPPSTPRRCPRSRTSTSSPEVSTGSRATTWTPCRTVWGASCSVSESRRSGA